MVMVEKSLYSTRKYTTFFVNTPTLQPAFLIIPAESRRKYAKNRPQQPLLSINALSNNKRPTFQGWSFLLHVTRGYFALFTALLSLVPNSA